MGRKKGSKNVAKKEVVEQIELFEEVKEEQPIIEEPIIEEVKEEVTQEKVEENLVIIDQIVLNWWDLGRKGYPREGMCIDYDNKSWKIIRVLMPKVVLHLI